MVDFERIQTKEVVAIAAIVPVGIDFDASAKSPDRLDPAIMPTNMINFSIIHNIKQAVPK